MTLSGLLSLTLLLFITFRIFDVSIDSPLKQTTSVVPDIYIQPYLKTETQRISASPKPKRTQTYADSPGLSGDKGSTGSTQDRLVHKGSIWTFRPSRTARGQPGSHGVKGPFGSPGLTKVLLGDKGATGD